MVPEVFIKGKHTFDSESVYQSKTGAVRKAQSLNVEPPENGFCRLLCIFRNPKHIDMASVHLIHELDGRGVTCPCLEQGIGFIQHIVRSIEDGLFFLNLPVYRFYLLIRFLQP